MTADKRDDILQATLRLISEQGFHGTPIAQIAQEANVGAGTIYRYFENKDVLIFELFVEIKRQFTQAMLAGFAEAEGTEGKFRQIWINTFNFCLQNPREMAFLEQYHNSPFQTPEIEALTQEYLLPVVDVFQAAIGRGEIKDIPFEMLTIFAYDVTVAHAKRHLTGQLVMDQANLEIAIQACWDAVKAE